MGYVGMDSRELKENKKCRKVVCNKPAANKIAAAVVISRYYDITFAEALNTVCKMNN